VFKKVQKLLNFINKNIDKKSEKFQ